MSEREFVRGGSEREQNEELAPLPTASTSAMDVSDLLDAIDLVLEENAEEFVKGFVQKGGQ
ncbi:MAG: Bacterial ubiquitin-like modifier [Actinomycetota bacterium]|jgi:ubiquitin-like protein Pup